MNLYLFFTTATAVNHLGCKFGPVHASVPFGPIWAALTGLYLITALFGRPDDRRSRRGGGAHRPCRPVDPHIWDGAQMLGDISAPGGGRAAIGRYRRHRAGACHRFLTSIVDRSRVPVQIRALAARRCIGQNAIRACPGRISAGSSARARRVPRQAPPRAATCSLSRVPTDAVCRRSAWFRSSNRCQSLGRTGPTDTIGSVGAAPRPFAPTITPSRARRCGLHAGRWADA